MTIYVEWKTSPRPIVFIVIVFCVLTAYVVLNYSGADPEGGLEGGGKSRVWAVTQWGFMGEATAGGLGDGVP